EESSHSALQFRTPDCVERIHTHRLSTGERHGTGSTIPRAGSSHIPMNPALRWFTGNIGYHHVHHLNARISFYCLPETMAAPVELQSPGVTTLGPLGVYRCLRLKLWNPNLQSLVSFAGHKVAECT